MEKITDMLFREILETDILTDNDSAQYTQQELLKEKQLFETLTDAQIEKMETLLNLYTSEFYAEVKKAFEVGYHIGAQLVLEIST